MMHILSNQTFLSCDLFSIFQGYKDQDSTKSSKSSGKEQDVSNQKRLDVDMSIKVQELYYCFTEAVSLLDKFLFCVLFPLSFRYIAKGDKFASPAFEDVSQSSRQIKKPVYRLTKPQAADPKPLSKEDGSTKSKRSSFQVPKGNCSNKEERETSERHSLHEFKHVGKRSSKHSNPSSRVRDKSKGSSSEKTPHGNSLSSKCQGSTATLVSDEQKDRSANAHKRKIEVESDTDRDHKEFKTRESSKTSSVSKHLLKQKEKELLEKLRTRLENTEFKAKRKFYKDEAPASAKDSTSGSSSNASNSSRTSSKNVNSISDRTNDSLSSRQPERPSSSSLPPNYKIPKVVQSTVADCATGNKSAASTHLKQRREPSNLGASVSSSITLKEAHRCSDATPDHVPDRKERKSSLLDQLPSASHSATDLWCDEVSKNNMCFFRKGTLFQPCCMAVVF